MGLFKGLKMTPAKAFKKHAESLCKQDGNQHILVAIEPTNGEANLNNRVNCLIDGMRNNGYQIIRASVMPHLGAQSSINIIYK